MKYFRQIDANLNNIIASAEGRLMTETIFNDKCQALFTNYILYTADQQFNVVGALQIIDEEKKAGPIFYLCIELNPNSSDIDDMVSMFFVGPRGRIYDEKLANVILLRFEIFRNKFYEKYKLHVNYPMYFTQKQIEFLDSLRK